MKKSVAAIIAAFGYFASSVQTFALQVSPPSDVGIAGGTAPTKILTSALTIIYVVAVVAVLFMLIIGAFQWIVSGGDKEAVSKARGRITNALIGLAILALAVVIVTIIAAILKIDITKNFPIPNLEGGDTNL